MGGESSWRRFTFFSLVLVSACLDELHDVRFASDRAMQHMEHMWRSNYLLRPVRRYTYPEMLANVRNWL